jgi:hypothetical protein
VAYGRERRGVCGTVNKTIEPTVTLVDRCTQPLNRAIIGDIKGNERWTSTTILHDKVVEFFQSAHRAREREDRRTASTKLACNSKPKAARGPRDKGYPPGICLIAHTGA